MYCERQGIDVSRGMSATVEKHMSTPPAQRRIARLPVSVTLPASIPTDLRERVEKVGHTCPVHATLHPDVDAPIVYRYM